MFLARYFGGGIDVILDAYCVESLFDMYADDFFDLCDSAVNFFKLESEQPVRVVLAGIESKNKK